MNLWVRSFGVIWIRISYPRSLGSWFIKGTDESLTRVDSSVPLMNHDPDDPKGTLPIFYHRNTQLSRSVEYANGSKNVKFAVVVRVRQTKQNSVVSRFCFAEEGKEMYKDL